MKAFVSTIDIRPHLPFGNPQSGECLAGAAGHDKFAAVMGFETLEGVFEGQMLVISYLLCFSLYQCIGARQAEILPINGRVFKDVWSPTSNGLVSVQ